MGLLDPLLHRRERRDAAARYRGGLEALSPAATRDEVAAARADAATDAGPHLSDAQRRAIDEELERRLSIGSARAYGDALHALPLSTLLDGSWRDRLAAERDAWATWLREEHRADEHWQVAESACERVLAEGRVTDADLDALDAFLAEVDPRQPRSTDDPWFERVAAVRLAAGLLPRPRGTARLITVADEVIVFSEAGTVLETYEELDAQDRVRTTTRTVDVRIDASDQRIAVFADELLFSVRWAAVVGAAAGEDAHGSYVRLDDADTAATHILHTPYAVLLATLARELHRRSGG